MERELHLGVGAYERSENRRGYANGYKPETVKTRVRELTLSVPEFRREGEHVAGASTRSTAKYSIAAQIFNVERPPASKRSSAPNR